MEGQFYNEDMILLYTHARSLQHLVSTKQRLEESESAGNFQKNLETIKKFDILYTLLCHFVIITLQHYVFM